jgi:hypothetical protein
LTPGPASKGLFEVWEAAMSPRRRNLGVWQWRLVETWTPKRHTAINCADKPRGQGVLAGFMDKTLPNFQKIPFGAWPAGSRQHKNPHAPLINNET